MERLGQQQLGLALRVVVVLGLAGCSNQQRTSANPFMAPDRVPPPATRTIAPGTAAPYYPGDPVPAAQAAAPVGTMVAQVPQVPTSSVATPPASVPNANSPAASVPTAPSSTSQPLAFSNERTVTVPTDSQDLRFAVPPPPAIQPPSATMSAPTAAGAAPNQQVIPASYNQQMGTQPVATQPAAAAALLPASSPAENKGGPWRSPQIPGTMSGVMQAQYVQPSTGQPTVLAAQSTQVQAATTSPPMPVQLRAVPSPMTGPTMASGQTMTAPPWQPQPSPPPRMRFPSWTDPTTWFTPQAEPTANQQLIGYMVPGPNGTQQMISVEQYQAMVAGGAQGATGVASSDGFRARGTKTK